MAWSKMAQQATAADGIMIHEGHKPEPLDIDMVGMTFRGEEYSAGRCYVTLGYKSYPAMAIANGDKRLITTDAHAIERLASWGCGLRIARRIIACAIKEGRERAKTD